MFPQYLDWINVMTYDYHGQWDKKTGQFRQRYINQIKLFSYYIKDFELLRTHVNRKFIKTFKPDLRYSI